MALPAEKIEAHYTYGDYCGWSDDERWEIINGVAYAMAPAPTADHQRQSVQLLRKIANYLDGKTCEVFHAPFDVRLDADAEDDSEDDTVVQPDIVVICDKTKIGKRGCIGAPDLIIEILSPSTARFDTTIKYNKYRKSGVKEYWVVNPETKSVQVHTLENGKYVTEAYTDEDSIKVGVLSDLVIDMKDIFVKEEE